jgi:hypothetical protein
MNTFRTCWRGKPSQAFPAAQSSSLVNPAHPLCGPAPPKILAPLNYERLVASIAQAGTDLAQGAGLSDEEQVTTKAGAAQMRWMHRKTIGSRTVSIAVHEAIPGGWGRRDTI